MEKMRLSFYFGVKHNGRILGDIADTIRCTINKTDVDTIIQDITTKSWVNIKTENGRRIINTKNLNWFEIEPSQNGKEQTKEKPNFNSIFDSLQ